VELACKSLSEGGGKKKLEDVSSDCEKTGKLGYRDVRKMVYLLKQAAAEDGRLANPLAVNPKPFKYLCSDVFVCECKEFEDAKDDNRSKITAGENKK